MFNVACFFSWILRSLNYSEMDSQTLLHLITTQLRNALLIGMNFLVPTLIYALWKKKIYILAFFGKYYLFSLE